MGSHIYINTYTNTQIYTHLKVVLFFLVRKEEAEKEKNAALAAGYLTKVGVPTGETPWQRHTFP